ncbi:hypothetical protein Clacol_004148 [Clathrus columnatus]|uniref:N-acetyltransferase domain-containing protein n=1 Tax=Clathrus columnatus TaxID=1419009 RepID=A0AAV5AB32_9AGAM|nr:hypothetical protein Clacol_004148 [Clathrus columnatus]
MSFKDNKKYGKIRIKQITLSPATLKDASAMSKIDLRAFEYSANRSVFLPQCAGMFGETLFQAAQATGAKELRMDIVGTDIVLKATVQYENEDEQSYEVLAGFGRWTSPDGPRKRTIWEWILSTIVFPIYNIFSPIEELPVETKRQIKEVFQYQLNATFGFGGKGYQRRYWYLHLLSVDPDWQGFGVGSKLLKWSCNKAAESGSLVYVETRLTAFK